MNKFNGVGVWKAHRRVKSWSSRNEEYYTVVDRLTEDPVPTDKKPSVLDALLKLDKTPEGSMSSKRYGEELHMYAASSSQSSSSAVTRGAATQMMCRERVQCI